MKSKTKFTCFFIGLAIVGLLVYPFTAIWALLMALAGHTKPLIALQNGNFEEEPDELD